MKTDKESFRAKINQLRVLIHKNFLLFWQRKFGVLFEVLLAVVLLFAFSFLQEIDGLSEKNLCLETFGPPQEEFNIWSFGRYADSRQWVITFAPNTEKVQELVEEAKSLKVYSHTAYYDIAPKIVHVEANDSLPEWIDKTNKEGDPVFAIFPDILSLNNYLSEYPETIRASVLFNELGNNTDYTITVNQGDYPYGTFDIKSLFQNSMFYFDSRSNYDSSGFLAIQQMIETSIINVFTDKKILPSFLLRSTPKPTSVDDNFVTYVMPYLVPYCFVIGAMFMAKSVANDIIGEKCSKMRETMRMMGLSDGIMWLAWIVSRFTITFIVSTLLTIVLKFCGYFPKADGSMIWIYLLLAFTFLNSFLFFCTSLIHSPRAAGFIICMVVYLTFLPYQIVSNTQNSTLIYGLSLLPVSGLCFGIKILSSFENLGVGIGWSNMHIQYSPLATANVAGVMWMFCLGTFIFSFLTWYIENVFPGEFGVPNKPWFFLTKQYWLGKGEEYDEFIDEDFDEKIDPTCHEKMPPNLKAGISIRGLSMTFKTLDGPKYAVKSLSAEIYEGQITALLGHNGAGKTTTINMLTGMFPPTSGDAMVAGCSVVENITGVRRSMGVCPQHNTLFDALTVEQHLVFFARLKGQTGDLQPEITYILETFNLNDKRSTPANKLSGGQKRKLSVAIALCGGSKMLLLDEPSTGMDVSAKRELWDMLLKIKEGKTIVFTTHSMDEADILGERIAIMAAGQIVCSGSSLFLKRRYGVGYNLTLVKDAHSTIADDVPRLTSYIQSHIPSAECTGNVGSEMTYVLATVDQPKFVSFFKDLEVNCGNFGIKSFGVSLTTMEEVFMKAGEGKDSNVAAHNGAGPGTGGSNVRQWDRSELNTGTTLLLQQFECQLKKRLIGVLRSRTLTLCQILIPAILLLFPLIAGNTSSDGGSSLNQRELTINAYPSDSVTGQLFYADLRKNKGDTNERNKILSYLREKEGLEVEDATEDCNRSYDEKDLDQCCGYPYLQLSTACINLINADYSQCYKEEYSDLPFTYRDCRQCFEGACDVKPWSPYGPDLADTKEKMNYFQNHWLNRSTAFPGDYDIGHQGAITFSDWSPAIHDISEGTVGDGFYVYNQTSGGGILTGWSPSKALHLLPALQSALTNIVLRLNGLEMTTRVTIRPIDVSKSNYYSFDWFTAPSPVVTFVIFSLTLVLGLLVQAPVEERVSKSKHLQQISGVNTIVYWLTMAITDYAIFLTACLLMLILLAAFGAVSPDKLPILLLFFILGGLANLPFVYIVSQIFKKTTTAIAATTTMLFFFSLIGYICWIVLYQTYGMMSDSDNWVPYMDGALMIIPTYSLGTGIGAVVMLEQKENSLEACQKVMTQEQCMESLNIPDSMWDLGGIAAGRYLLALAIAAIVYSVLLIVGQIFWYRLRAELQKFFTPRRDPLRGEPGVIDEDVAAESERVRCGLHSLIQQDSVTIAGLHRRFGDFTAVDSLDLSIGHGETFGLLGVNGAGKSTTFNMLTGETALSGGAAYLHGFDVTRQLRQAQQFIGYCPQFDALIGYMSGRELLRMFAQLRGVPSNAVEQTVFEIVTMLNLEDHADKACRGYSGGNKRKLSTGIAIIGSPSLVFLDEPTAGVDPTARRFLWNVLCELRNAGCSIVLTSHSMEECEALCTRIVIMVNGAFKCHGSIQHLKSKFSQGFKLCTTMAEADQANIAGFIEHTFPGSKLKDHYPGYLQYNLPNTNKWSGIFEVMETHKEGLKVLDYSVSQTSLEEVFLDFAKLQKTHVKKTFCQRFCPCCCCVKSSETAPETTVVIGNGSATV